jgi:branched-chain amino acid transport system permease protein
MTQELVNGVVLGAGYALVAIGWTVLLSAARIVNFAHGQLYMLGAFCCWWVVSELGVPYGLAVLVAVAAVTVLGLAMQLAMTRLTVDQDLIGLTIVTLGFGSMIQGGATIAFGGTPRTVDSTLESADIHWGEAFFTLQDVVVVGLALALFALVWFVLARTRVGRVVRAVAEDPRLTALVGINPAVVYLGLFAFEAAAVAFAGALFAPQSPIHTGIGFEQVVLTFVVVVLGGIGSVLGGLVAGMALGLFTSFFGSLVSPAYTTAAAFAVVLVVLAARPQGVLGRA